MPVLPQSTPCGHQRNRRGGDPKTPLQATPPPPKVLQSHSGSSWVRRPERKRGATPREEGSVCGGDIHNRKRSAGEEGQSLAGLLKTWRPGAKRGRWEFRGMREVTRTRRSRQGGRREGARGQLMREGGK